MNIKSTYSSILMVVFLIIATFGCTPSSDRIEDDRRDPAKVSFDAKEIMDKIKQACSTIDEYKAQNPINDSVIVIGDTGVGKSTLINGLLNKKLKAVKSDTGFDDDDYVIECEEKDNCAKISHGPGSETTIPGLYNFHNSCLWDCPGFEDTKGINQDIINAFCIKKLFDISKMVKVVLVINHDAFKDPRAMQLRKTIRKLSQFFNHIDSVKDSICLAITKTQANPDVRKYIRTLEEILKNQDASTERFSESEEYVYKLFIKSENKIATVNKGDRPGPYTIGDSLPKMINKLSYANDTKVTLPISDQSKNQIHNLVDSVRLLADEESTKFIKDVQNKLNNFDKSDTIRHASSINNVYRIVSEIISTKSSVNDNNLEQYKNYIGRLCSATTTQYTVSHILDTVLFCKQVIGENFREDLSYFTHIKWHDLQQIIVSLLTRDKDELENIYNTKKQELSRNLNEYLNTIKDDQQELQTFIDNFKKCSNSIKENRQGFLVAIDIPSLSSKLTDIKELTTKLYELNASLEVNYRLNISIDSLKSFIDTAVLEAEKLLSDLKSKLEIEPLKKALNSVNSELAASNQIIQESQNTINKLDDQIKNTKKEAEKAMLEIQKKHEEDILSIKRKQEEDLKNSKESIKKLEQNAIKMREEQAEQAKQHKIDLTNQAIQNDVFNIIQTDSTIEVTGYHLDDASMISKKILSMVELNKDKFNNDKYLKPGIIVKIFSANCIKINSGLSLNAHLILVAPKIEFGQVKINLSGQDGYSGRNADNYDGQGGYHGTPGYPGASLLMISESYAGLDNLTINTSGGHGGNGGDGAKGRDAKGILFGSGYNGGNGGNGAQGGEPGSVWIYDTDGSKMTNGVQIISKNGKDGLGGKGGQKGIGNFIGWNGKNGVNGNSGYMRRHVFEFTVSDILNFNNVSGMYCMYMNKYSNTNVENFLSKKI